MSVCPLWFIGEVFWFKFRFFRDFILLVILLRLDAGQNPSWIVLLGKNKFLNELVFRERLCLVEDRLMNSPHDVVVNTVSQSPGLEVKPQEVVVLFDLGVFLFDVIIFRILACHYRDMLKEHDIGV